jgi:beta-glucosidase/6-phospho-beta-glucosidase/beta-galactosidase
MMRVNQNLPPHPNQPAIGMRKFMFATGIENSYPTIYIITKQYYKRYRLPVMHTETNCMDAEEAPHWLLKEWQNMQRLKLDGVPIIGFTWYSLTDQVDWDSALREDAGHVNELGLVDLNREMRPVGRAYKKLIEQWRDILPTESLGLAFSY